MSAPLTLDQFRAMRATCDDIAEAVGCDADGFTTNVGYLYEGHCFVEKIEPGVYSAPIGNDEFISDLASVEEHLYREWYLPEVAGVL